MGASQIVDQLVVAAIPKNSIHPRSRAEWRTWLRSNHARSEGVWLISFKKATGKPHVEYGESVEEALCFGWIDSKPNKLDAERSMRWFAPRKVGTAWSKLNKERVKRLTAARKMHTAGNVKVAAARKDGSWSALDAVEALEIPKDLAAALADSPTASAHFDAFPKSVKKSILDWIRLAKRPETRSKRIVEVARLAARNLRANQWRP